SEGDDKTAHEFWQQAAMLQPDNEQVWTALMWVIDNDEDRKVCLKNILTINPSNIQAQRMLDDLIGETQPQTDPIIADVTPSNPNKIYVTRVLVLGTIFGVGIATIIILLQLLITQG
ncbi:MAG: hypothetical protein AAFV93_10185, partial [Chloroflexota bacterium]